MMKQVPKVTKCGLDGKFAIAIENLIPLDYCMALCDRGEAQGFEEALVNIGGGRQKAIPELRNSTRSIIDCPKTTEEIWQMILTVLNNLDGIQQKDLGLSFLYNPFSGWSPVGLNERMRILKYIPGQYFRPHSDSSYIREKGDLAGIERQGELSYLTCLIFLNDCLEGGETALHGALRTNKVQCRAGTVLLFDHSHFHEGCPIIRGEKYVVRTDLMYSKIGPGNEYAVKPIVLPKATNASDSFDEKMAA